MKQGNGGGGDEDRVRIRGMAGRLCPTEELDLNPSYALCATCPFAAPTSDITN